MSGPFDQPFSGAWIAAYFAEVDRMDPPGLMAWYAEDGVFRFAGQKRVHGKPAIEAVLREFYGSIRAMHHRMTGVWIDASAQSGVWEAEVDFTGGDDRRVTIPAVSVLRLRDGLVADFRFVMDAAPLYAEAQP